MRTARNLAVAFTLICLIVAAVDMLSSTKMTFCAGSDCSATVDCGSPAFPNALIDFASPDDAANCAGATSASVALYGVVLAGVGLGVVVLTSRRKAVEGSRTASGAIGNA